MYRALTATDRKLQRLLTENTTADFHRRALPLVLQTKGELDDFNTFENSGFGLINGFAGFRSRHVRQRIEPRQRQPVILEREHFIHLGALHLEPRVGDLELRADPIAPAHIRQVVGALGQAAVERFVMVAGNSLATCSAMVRA